MSVRLEYEVRRRLGAILEQVGTPPVGRALLLLAALFVASELSWGTLGSREAASVLGASNVYRLLAGALILDGIVALLRAVPVERGADGAPTLSRVGLSEWATLALRGSRVLLGFALLASVLSRDVLVIRVAEGEDLSASPEQVIGRAPARPFSPGPFAAPLSVRQVLGDAGADGTTRGLAVEVEDGGRSRRTTPWRPLWFGFGRLLVPVRAGFTLRYSLELPDGRIVDSAFAKLDLLPAGRREPLRSTRVPHRFLVGLPDGESNASRKAPEVEVSISRGKMLVAKGIVAPGGSLAFEGLRLRVPEWRRWVEFRMVRDPGLGVAGIAALVALIGLAARVAASRIGRG